MLGSEKPGLKLSFVLPSCVTVDEPLTLSES